MLFGIDGLYKISIVNISLISHILEAMCAKVLETSLGVCGTVVMLNYWKLEISLHTSC